MNNYEQMCLELDKKLAELLGYTNVKDAEFFAGQLIGYDIHNDTKGTIARWTQDDGEAFRLMVEHCLDITTYKREVKVMYDDGFSEQNVSEESFITFPDRPSAYRFAIVKSVIGKLSSP